MKYSLGTGKNHGTIKDCKYKDIQFSIKVV